MTSVTTLFALLKILIPVLILGLSTNAAAQEPKPVIECVPEQIREWPANATATVHQSHRGSFHVQVQSNYYGYILSQKYEAQRSDENGHVVFRGDGLKLTISEESVRGEGYSAVLESEELAPQTMICRET